MNRPGPHVASPEEARVDAALAHGDRAVPGLAHVLDETLLRRWTGMPAARVDRLRHKPSTSLRAAVDPGDGGPWWLVAAHSESSWRKVGKDVRAARGAAVLDEGLRLVRVPVLTDRALPHLADVAAGARSVAHNPARRAVLRHERWQECRKVHADAGTAVRSVRASRALRAAGVDTPPADLLPGTGRHVVRTPWLSGRAAGDADRPAVADLVQRWAGTDTRGLPVLDRTGLRRAVERAVLGTPHLDAAFGDRLRRTASRWAQQALEHAPDLVPDVFAHGDLSADQLLRSERGWVVLDVDRACRAPSGWDLACWDAAVVAAGGAAGGAVGGGDVPTGDVPDVLRAAAALLRAPEPFRRRRDGWAGATRRLLDVAARAVGA